MRQDERSRISVRATTQSLVFFPRVCRPYALVRSTSHRYLSGLLLVLSRCRQRAWQAGSGRVVASCGFRPSRYYRMACHVRHRPVNGFRIQTDPLPIPELDVFSRILRRTARLIPGFFTAQTSLRACEFFDSCKSVLACHPEPASSASSVEGPTRSVFSSFLG